MTEPVYEAEKAKAASGRIGSTKIQGNDQIVAISSLSIHTFLDARWDAAIGKKDKRIKEFNHTTTNGAIIATMNAPRLELVVPEGPESVYFIINFMSGTFDYWKGRGPEAKLKKQSVEGWKIYFSTSFSLKELVAVPPEIAKQITILKPGQYSVSQLVLSLSAAATSRLQWSKCITPNMPGDQDLRIEVQSTFEDYINRYLKYLESGPYSVLGYAIKVDDPSAAKDTPAPSFPPQRVKCRTHAYVPQTDDYKTKYAGLLDCIIFEEMTEDRKFPEVPYDPLKAGNWVVPGTESSIVMSRKVIFERFLLPRFQLLNDQVITLANDAYFWVHGNKDKKMSGNDWFIADESKPSSPGFSINGNAASYSKVFERKRSENSFFGGQWRDNLTTKIDTSVSITAGTGKLTATVKIDQYRDHWTGGHGGGTDTIDGGYLLITWSVDAELTNAKDGKLDMSVKYNTPDLSYRYESSNRVWDFGGSTKARYESEALSAMKQGTDLSSAQEKLKEALAGQSKFVFPGAGEFDLKDPVFNDEGDLLLGLTYFAKKFAIDDDFHLQTYDTSEKKTSPEVDKKWIKITGEQDGALIQLVAEQKDATLFQLDDGALTVDMSGKPTGLRTMLKNKLIVDSKGPFVHDILQMATKETFNNRDKENQTLECSTTASRFVWSLSDMATWRSYFCLDETEKTRVCLFTGDEEDPGSVKAFGVHAIY